MDFVEQVKSSVDIVSVVGERVKLKRMGSTGRYVGLCPFHNEKTPSFSVNSVHQYFKCFGCGKGGDVFKFLMEDQGLSFFEALKQLAEQHGLQMPRRSEYSDPETRLRAALHRMHEIAEESFRAQLSGPQGALARAYVEKRGIAGPIAAQFALGYSAGSGQTLVRLFQKEGFTAEQLELSGLVRKRDDGSFYDSFRNRLIFPIHNDSGKPIAFAGRALGPDDQPKYLNSPETPIYRKSYVLYNMHRAKEGIRKRDRLVLVEGYMDVIGVYASGISEVVASCGTALTNQQVQALRRHSLNITVNFDPDAAGLNAAERSIQMLLEEGMRVHILQLDDALDPDEYCKEHGAEAYRAQLDGAKSYFYWLADRARERFDMRSVEGRVAAFQFLLPAVHRMPDKIERVAVANDIAAYLGVDAGLILENFRKAAAGRQEKRVAAAAQEPREDEKLLVNLLLVDAEARRVLIPELRTSPVVEQFTARRILKTIFAVEESGAAVTFAAVDARLDDNDRELLHSISLSADANSEVLTLENGMHCLENLRVLDRKSAVGDLKTRLKQAERAGNLEEAMRLMKEIDSLGGGHRGSKKGSSSR
jgi:DNA primase